MTEKEMNEETSFEELLKASSEAPGRRMRPGERIEGRVAKIGKDTVFVDLGGKSEGLADIGEFLDGKRNLTVKPGDRVEMRVASVKDGIHLTKGMKVQGADLVEVLQEAKENLIRLKGRYQVLTKEVLKSTFQAFAPSAP